MTRSAAAFALVLALAHAAAAAEQIRAVGEPSAASGEVTFTATPVNVAEARGPVKIHILRWSTDEERAALTRALSIPAPSPRGAASGAEGAAGTARGGRAAADGRGGRGGPGRGGRGAGRGDAAPNPIAALTAAIARAQTVGYIWTTDVTGYSIKYAYRAPFAGGERIVLATDRRFGANSIAWTLPPAAPSTAYAFTVFELRLDATGSGEAKTSLTAAVVVDDEAKTVALRDYATALPILALRTSASR